MNVLFLPKEGVSLYRELLNSETSRGALRSIARSRPVRDCHLRGFAWECFISRRGSPLVRQEIHAWRSLRLSPGVYCSYGLAREVYFARAVTLEDTWEFRLTYRMKDGKVVREEQVLPGRGRSCLGTTESPAIEVWCTEDGVPLRYQWSG